MKDELLSVGIDIGTSTTQLVFSKITVKNTASSFSVPKVAITDKKTVYKSRIYFTPLLNRNTIDCDAIKTIIENEYHKAGVAKERINTGAVIITGETARKENAREVLSALSGFAGDFVVAAAGPDLESIISGKGAGACDYSKTHGNNVLNIDIGGGTSNYALFSNGEVSDTGCMDIGGRLIKLDKERKITYISPKIKNFFTQLNEGDFFDEKTASEVTKTMTEALLQGAGVLKRNEIFENFVTNKGINPDCQIDCISFSGGVSDCIYNPDSNDLFKYGDIGGVLGKAVRNSKFFEIFKPIKCCETIRATVVGAGMHTTEISGSTILYDEEILPIKNMPVLKLTENDEKNMDSALGEKINWYKTEKTSENPAIAFRGVLTPTFENIELCAETITKYADGKRPIVVVTENDIAKALGQSIKSRTEVPVVCIDGISLANGDYIDIGNPAADGAVVPIVIKTLVFN